jgi:isoleucyl-tRNA synthetase
MFEPVPKEFNVPEIEKSVLHFWESNEIEKRYLERNKDADERFSFLDGPITANGPMGVHHAWGRTYKDLWQRYNTMLGKRQRYQNGFDCQGLWVEVTVERQLGFKSKRDIEEYGVAEFVRKCKEDVLRWAGLMTSQSRRLGYFMDWDHSYYTMSDENNYTIWHFLKTCHERGLLYRGTDVMPWCTRCGTGLSETEVAEGYQDLTHRSVYVKFPVLDYVIPTNGQATDEPVFLLVWTTTPWTLTSNVAVAVNPKLQYVLLRRFGEQFIVQKDTVVRTLGKEFELGAEFTGADMLGWRYEGAFDELPAVEGVEHVVIPWDEVSEAEGTGLVHIAPGCGKEDFALGKQFGLKVIAPLDGAGRYRDGFGALTGRDVHEVAETVIESLRAKSLLFKPQSYTHRYPTCWRCGTELVFRLVDEWFISMDPLREPMMDVVRSIRWLPPYGLERELDWLRNMDDWMISKKRYWGLALPFWLCPSGHLHVVGSRDELFERALNGLDHLESPHRPWVDEVKIACPECGQVAERIADVGNPWLDAGIVPFSTLGYRTDPDWWRQWFPADFITESFPGQFRNWFYSLLAMGTVLENAAPMETVLGFALVRDESGREMHKSWGNLIPFDEAADRAGADMMRWLFARNSPETNVNFGWESLDEVKRRLLVLWNTYSFFVTYANVDGWTPEAAAPAVAGRPQLDRWILSRLNALIFDVRKGLDAYDAAGPARDIEQFIEEVSTWYVRRSRRRFWKSENDSDKSAAYATLYECLVTLSRLVAPFMPFVSESFYQNLVARPGRREAASVHLTDFPVADESLIDSELLNAMQAAQQVVGLGRAARERANVKIRQPLARMYVKTPSAAVSDVIRTVESIILDELNVKRLEFATSEDDFVSYTVRPNLPALGPRFGKQVPMIRTALEQLDPAEVVRAIESGQVITLDVNGDEVVLGPTDVLTSAVRREGYAAMGGDGYLVALDTELTRDLFAERLAREVIRRINDWRKAAGLNIDDRIAVRYEASPDLREAMELHRNYIMGETLTVKFDAGDLTGRGFSASDSFAGQTVRVELEGASDAAARSAD